MMFRIQKLFVKRRKSFLFFLFLFFTTSDKDLFLSSKRVISSTLDHWDANGLTS